VHRPRVVLADEPTGNLDPRTATDVLQLLRERILDGGGAGILITHSRAVADTADRAYALDGRNLSLLATRTPEPLQ
jgi:putative ABC transport system ATP-binding protein